MSNRLDVKKYIKENLTFIIFTLSVGAFLGYLLNSLAPEPVEFEVIECWELNDFNFCYAEFTKEESLVTSVICNSENTQCIPYEVFLLSDD